MRKLFAACLLLTLTACRSQRDDPNTVVMVIETSPNNLDLRQGTDAQSEYVGGLIFDALVKKGAHYILQPWLATSWEQPNPLTWVFHLRSGVRFHDGRGLTSADVAYTVRSMIDGSLITAKGGAFAAIASVETRDPLTVIVHLKHSDPALLFNMSDGLFGVVPAGSGKDLGLHPIGSGPFRFLAATQDKEVVVERNPDYWAGPPYLKRVRFAIVPDAITTALELQKGSADVASNVITLDMVHALRDTPNLVTETGPSSRVIYANFNTQDPILKDKRVRQAIAYALDRPAIIAALWRGKAQAAATFLPAGHWAAAHDPPYPHDPARAQALLEAAGYPPGEGGVRLRLTLKTSTDETTRLFAAVLQQQLRLVGIDLQTRSAEFGTFYADVSRGAFQMYVLRWIGSNEDPDIFRYAYASGSFPPKGGNRGRYSNPGFDALLAQAAATADPAQRRALYIELQQILAEDVPGIPLWYPDNVVLHTRRLQNVTLSSSSNFDFLRNATLQP